MSEYSNRQELKLDHWPELRQKVSELVNLVNSERTIPQEFKRMLFTMASLAGGCTHCQSHGAFALDKMNVETARIQAMWEYETSDLFTDAERAAFDVMRDSSQSPNAVGPEHFDKLRKYYSSDQIIEIVAMSSLAGWLNRWNDTIATVTDQESVDWATENLTDVGWEIGKHAGEAHEQLKGHPSTMGWTTIDSGKEKTKKKE